MAAVSGTDAWAAGSRPDRAGFPVTLAEHWNGTAWRQAGPSPKPPLPPSPADVLYAVATVSAVDAWAVGGAGEMSGQMAAGLAEHWNGRHWVAATIPRLREGGQLEGVAAVSAREVWAVGSGGVTSAYGSQVAYALRWDGARWSRVPVPVPGMFHGLNAVARIPGTRQLWAVGFRAARPGSPQYPLIERWNGTHWTVTPAPAVTGGYLTAVTALSPVSAWAVGGIASPSGPPAGQVILHWNGTAWSRVPPASRENLAGVAALSASDAWAAGGAILHWNGQTWTTAASVHAGAALSAITTTGTASSWTTWSVGRASSRQALTLARCSQPPPTRAARPGRVARGRPAPPPTRRAAAPTRHITARDRA